MGPKVPRLEVPTVLQETMRTGEAREQKGHPRRSAGELSSLARLKD